MFRNRKTAEPDAERDGQATPYNKVLVARAVEVTVFALLSYFGFLADVKQTLTKAEGTMSLLAAKQLQCETDVSELRQELEQHRKGSEGISP